VGVNASQNPLLKLRFAVNDARRMQQVLLDRMGRSTGTDYTEVVPIALLSDYDASGQLTQHTATKAHFEAVLKLLAGKGEEVTDRLLKEIPNAAKIKKATPNDLLLISFSSHGDADSAGNFYLLPYDVGTADEIAPIRQHSISSAELSRWLRYVDAGEMMLIVDACHSAASVEGGGFKPGPMGSRGLGQLAYDKGMRILAASQAADVALENQNLQQGLLSYALVQEGLVEDKADAAGDGKITVVGWLGYGVQEVPKLHEAIRSGQLKNVGVGRGVVLVDTLEAQQRPSLQQPSLFDFKKKRRDVLLVGTK
jgi:uncharacterized caspase-like protein